MNHLYILGGIGTLGVASGGAFLIHNSFSKKTNEPTLRSRLEKEKYSVMEDSNSHWSDVLTKHNDSGVYTNKKFSEKIATIEDLKNKCNRSLYSNDSLLYEQVKIWCTVPRTVQERLKDLNIEILSITDETETGAKVQWIKLKDQYKTASVNEKMKEFTIQEPEAVDSWKKLREECNKHVSKSKWDSEYDYYLNKVVTWCSSASSLLS